MHCISLRSMKRPRPVLMLEALEDRRVLSAGGLFTVLQPLATAGPSHSSLLSTLNSLVAVPTNVLSSVGATVQNLGSSVLPGVVKTAASNLPANLNMDLPFLHVDNLRLDLGVHPIGSDQPLLTLGGGGKVAVGPTTNGPVNVAPEVQLGLGGSPIVNPGVAAPVTVGAGQGILDLPTGPTTAPLAGVVAGAGVSLNSPPSNGGVLVAVAPPAPGVIFGGSSSAALLVAPDANRVDGGGGANADAALAAAPLADAPVADAVAARPFDLGGGTDAETVLASPDLQTAELATRFQPYSLNEAGGTLDGLLGPVAPKAGWLAVWWARLSHLAPWLTGLIAAGAALEIYRRRRRAARALGRPLV
jgi:hypothetical protein